MDSDKKKMFRVQGRDIPVPVDDSGVRAGHSPPSASDCQIPPVNPQAQVFSDATVLQTNLPPAISQKADGGKEEGLYSKVVQKENAFERRDSISRTPPRKNSGATNEASLCSTPTVANFDKKVMHTYEISTSEEEESNSQHKRTTEALIEIYEQKKKKKRMSESPRVIQQSDIQPTAYLTKLKTKIDQIEKFSIDKTNFQKDIKGWIKQTSSIMRGVIEEYKYENLGLINLKQEYQAYKKEQEEKYLKLKNDLEKLKEKQKMVASETRSEQLQKPTICTKCRNNLEENNTEPEIDLDIENVETYEDFVEISKKNWHSKCFTNTKLEYLDILQCKADNITFILENKTNTRDNNEKRILKRFPELTEGEGYDCSGGRIVAVEQVTTLRTKVGTNVKKKNILGAFYDPTEDEYKRQEDLYEILKGFKQFVEKQDNKNLVIQNPKDVREETMIKLTEAVFHSSQYEVKIMISSKEQGKLTRKRGEAVLIENGSGDVEITYAETVKKLKEELKDEETKNKILQVKKTIQGKVLIKVKDNAKSVKEAVAKIVQNC
ncbi:hypothetical protein Zmor_003617 [Zophobas morio]|uniref:Uncharacterized protein n=1 Tax=Zophobas morio TaxID=2755281 RepID=A0AA38HLT8_9CUCU|nr:hypothetical protein Zmor_003617 [Zophobas morio]